MQIPVYVAESGCTINVGGDTVTPSGVAANDCMTFAQANAAANIPLSPGAIRTLSLYDPDKPVWAVWRALWNGSTWSKLSTLQENGALSQPGNILVTFVHYPAVSAGHIEGYRIVRLAPSGQCIKAEPGQVWINGNVYENTGDITDLTGDSVAGGSFTGAVSSHYFVYLYDDAGTRKLEFDLGVVASGNFTNEPAWDAGLQQFSHPTLGAGYRFIGSFNTDSSGNCERFRCLANGKTREFYTEEPAGHYFVFLTPKVETWQEVKYAPFCPSMASHAFLRAAVRNDDASAAEVLIAVHSHGTLTTTQVGVFNVRGYAAADQGYVYFPLWEFPLEGLQSLYYTNTAIGGISASLTNLLGIDGYRYRL